jgi:hypothetical protein
MPYSRFFPAIENGIVFILDNTIILRGATKILVAVFGVRGPLSVHRTMSIAPRAQD